MLLKRDSNLLYKQRMCDCKKTNLFVKFNYMRNSFNLVFCFVILYIFKTQRHKGHVMVIILLLIMGFNFLSFTFITFIYAS